MANEEYKAKLRALFAPCMAREDLAGKIEVVSLEWLMEMSDPEPSESLDLGADKAGTLVGLAELAKDIKRRGLLEPMVVAVGVSTGRARLEGGNHRTRVLLDMGVLHAPAVCWVGASHVGFESNGSHQGRIAKLWPDFRPLVTMGRYDERHFERPSAVLPQAPVWSFEDTRPVRVKTQPQPVPAERPVRTPRKAKAGSEGAGEVSEPEAGSGLGEGAA